MTPHKAGPEDRTEHSKKSKGRRHRVERATRHGLRLPLRYRLDGQENWRTGETINISRSGILFYSNEILEVDSHVEIIFEASSVGLLHSNTQRAMVVRRMLSNWPETRPILGARFGG
jgi:hypothetical protein